MGAVALNAALDGDARAAVADGDGAKLLGDDACGVLVGSRDSAGDVQVLNHAAIFHVTERRGVFLGEGFVSGAVGDGERVALAVEGAHEVVVAAARHAGDGDVLCEQHGLADEAVVNVVVLQGVAEKLPVVSGVDGVVRPYRHDGHILGRHGEGVALDGFAVHVIGNRTVWVFEAEGDGSAAWSHMIGRFGSLAAGWDGEGQGIGGDMIAKGEEVAWHCAVVLGLVAKVNDIIVEIIVEIVNAIANVAVFAEYVAIVVVVVVEGSCNSIASHDCGNAVLFSFI